MSDAYAAPSSTRSIRTFTLLADQAGGLADAHVRAVELADRRRRVVAVDLDELDLDLGAFDHRRSRGKVGELSLGDDDEVVEMHVGLALEEEAPLRQRPRAR